MRWHVIEGLVKSEGWQFGVELGVYEGDTFKHLLTSCPGLRLVGVDLFDSDFFQSTREGRPERTFNLEQSYEDLIHWRANHQYDAKLIRMPTIDAARFFEDGSCDFVFIDADHRYEAVNADIHAWFSKVRKGGMIIGHDYNPQEFPGVVQAVNEWFGDDVQLYDDHVWACRC